MSMRIFGKEIYSDDAAMIYIRKEFFNRNQEIHMHDFVEVDFIIHGRGIHRVDQKEYPVNRGDLIFVNYNQTHSFEVYTEMVFYNLFLSPDFFDEALQNSQDIFDVLRLTVFEEFRAELFPEKSFLHFEGESLLEIEGFFETLLREQTEKQTGYKNVLHMQCVSLFVYIFRKMLESVEIETKESISIDEITRYVEENCTEKISLTELAQKSFYNPSYFSRVFKKKNGISLIEFIHKHRINKACELLKNQNLTVEEIALEVGYQDRCGFYTQFKKYVGCLPTEFKEM